MPTFRVHYTLTGLAGIAHHQEDVAADSPDEAAARVAERLHPRRPAIGKIKLVRDEPRPDIDANHPYGIEHPVLP